MEYSLSINLTPKREAQAARAISHLSPYIRLCYSPAVIGLKDPHETLRLKLRTMPDKELIEYGRAAKERCKDRQNTESWVELRLAREEWLSRHPKRRR